MSTLIANGLQKLLLWLQFNYPLNVVVAYALLALIAIIIVFFFIMCHNVGAIKRSIVQCGVPKNQTSEKIISEIQNLTSRQQAMQQTQATSADIKTLISEQKKTNDLLKQLLEKSDTKIEN